MGKEFIGILKVSQSNNIKEHFNKILIKDLVKCYLRIKENIKAILKIIYFMDKVNTQLLSLFI